MTDHAETVNKALHTLLRAEFDEINIVYANEFEPTKFKLNEYMRYFLAASTPQGFHSAGENRNYNYDLFFYFAPQRWTLRKYEQLLMDRKDRLAKLVFDNNTYRPGGAYKWHQITIEFEEIANLDLEDYEKVQYMEAAIVISRFCDLS